MYNIKIKKENECSDFVRVSCCNILEQRKNGSKGCKTKNKK